MSEFVNIRNLREDNDLTQTDIANILHISQRAYSHYENGTRELPISILIDLARYYDVSIDYLLGETTNKKRYK
ncbi:MAG: helix-turn-helix domain-containing protein [Eubacterium sp.]|nr:helix-turn-helix domain-containing protein [Eubacterium sp.]